MEEVEKKERREEGEQKEDVEEEEQEEEGEEGEQKQENVSSPNSDVLISGQLQWIAAAVATASALTIPLLTRHLLARTTKNAC